MQLTSTERSDLSPAGGLCPPVGGRGGIYFFYCRRRWVCPPSAVSLRDISKNISLGCFLSGACGARLPSTQSPPALRAERSAAAAPCLAVCLPLALCVRCSCPAPINGLYHTVCICQGLRKCCYAAPLTNTYSAIIMQLQGSRAGCP